MHKRSHFHERTTGLKAMNCNVCETDIQPGRHGRPRKYCGERCRSRARRAEAKKRTRLQLVAKDERPQAKVLPAGFAVGDVETLHPQAKEWVETVFHGWEIPLSEHPLVLMAGAALSRAVEARELIDRDGLILPGIQKPHPAVTIERDATTLFARLLKQLEVE